MRRCSVTKQLQIVRGSFDDYKELAHFHYRDNRPGAFTAIFALRPAKTMTYSFGTKTIGVIVYRTPNPRNELRNIATDNLFIGLDRETQLALVNKNIRCISRVILEPRFRGLGLASWLVRETMPQMNVPIVEGMAVMGAVNPFLERAGMSAYAAKMPVRCVQLTEAFSMVGIEKEILIDPPKVQQKIDRLPQSEAKFIELQMKRFLNSYGESRNLPAGLKRTRFVLSRLTFRPVYYIWFNPKIGFRV
ncbi:MAG: hypothetical protein ACYSW4_05955 [Planctomycetota bacterium]|jgi:hypothetical protein